MPAFHNFMGAQKAETPPIAAAYAKDQEVENERRAQMMENLMGATQLGFNVYKDHGGDIAKALRGKSAGSEASSMFSQVPNGGDHHVPSMDSYDPAEYESSGQSPLGGIAKAGVGTALMSSGNPYAMAAGVLLQMLG